MCVRRVVLGEHGIVTTDTDEVSVRTFLLVHGIGMGNSYFAQLSSALEPHGRVVDIDVPGFGDAPEPALALTMAQMGELLIALDEAEGLDRPVLVGQSIGTQVVAEAAAQRPEMFPELVLGAPTVNRLERTIKKQSWRMVQDLFGESPKAIAIGVQSCIKAGPRWFIKKLNNMMLHNIEEPLPRIQSHTRVVRGSRDRVCPRNSVEEAAALITGATMVEVAMVEVAGCSHETIVKNGACVAGCVLAHVGAA